MKFSIIKGLYQGIWHRNIGAHFLMLADYDDYFTDTCVDV